MRGVLCLLALLVAGSWAPPAPSAGSAPPREPGLAAWDGVRPLPFLSSGSSLPVVTWPEGTRPPHRGLEGRRDRADAALAAAAGRALVVPRSARLVLAHITRRLDAAGRCAYSTSTPPPFRSV